jgi:hypothetical protein
VAAAGGPRYDIVVRDVLGRGRVSLLAILDTWHSKTLRDTGHLLIHSQHSCRDLYSINARNAMPPPIQRQVIDSTDFSLGGAWSAELYHELYESYAHIILWVHRMKGSQDIIIFYTSTL